MLKRNGRYGLAEVYSRSVKKGYTRYTKLDGTYPGEKVQTDIKYVPIESIRFPTYGKR